jgi:hypothetical protein
MKENDLGLYFGVFGVPQQFLKYSPHTRRTNVKNNVFQDLAVINPEPIIDLRFEGH